MKENKAEVITRYIIVGIAFLVILFGLANLGIFSALLMFLALFTFIPSLIALLRRHLSYGAITTLCVICLFFIFLGPFLLFIIWLPIILWFIALIWSMSGNTVSNKTVYIEKELTIRDTSNKFQELKKLLEEDHINQAEYENKKKFFLDVM